MARARPLVLMHQRPVDDVHVPVPQVVTSTLEHHPGRQLNRRRRRRAELVKRQCPRPRLRRRRRHLPFPERHHQRRHGPTTVRAHRTATADDGTTDHGSRPELFDIDDGAEVETGEVGAVVRMRRRRRRPGRRHEAQLRRREARHDDDGLGQGQELGLSRVVELAGVAVAVGSKVVDRVLSDSVQRVGRGGSGSASHTF